MNLFTDDEIFRVRLIYLGPPGYTLPFQATYAQYGLFALLAGGLLLGGWLLTGSWLVIGPCIAVALFLTSYIGRYVTGDVPARKVVKTLLRDSRRMTSTTEPQQLPRLTGRHITFRTSIVEETR